MINKIDAINAKDPSEKIELKSVNSELTRNVGDVDVEKEIIFEKVI